MFFPAQSRIQGYMYNILSETDYQERMLPETPPRAKTPPSPAEQRQGGIALIDTRPLGGVRREVGSGQLYGGRPLLPARPGDRTSVFRRGREQVWGLPLHRLLSKILSNCVSAG